MAYIDYYGIESKIQSILQADPSLAAINAYGIEEPLDNLAEMCPSVGIFLDKREPASVQVLAAGRRSRMKIYLSIWVQTFAVEAGGDAIAERDKLMGQIETSLMQDRTLSSTVQGLMLEGGQFMSRRTNRGFVSAGEIIVSCEAVAST